jgi:hypothetical protein
MKTAPMMIIEHVFIRRLFFCSFLLIECRACQRRPFESSKKFNDTHFLYGFSNSNAPRDRGVRKSKRRCMPAAVRPIDLFVASLHFSCEYFNRLQASEFKQVTECSCGKTSNRGGKRKLSSHAQRKETSAGSTPKATAWPRVQNEATPQKAEDEKHLGSGKLRDKIALVIGGDGGIGRAVVIAFGKEGAMSQSFILEKTKTRYAFFIRAYSSVHPSHASKAWPFSCPSSQ